MKRGRRKLNVSLWFTPQEVSKLYGCHLNTVYNWIKRDGLTVKRKGGRILVNKDDLEKFLARWDVSEKKEKPTG